MANQKISIALCTFNGAEFLHEQLASLATQTRLADELVVYDDCSTDGTVGIVREFQKQAPFPVRVVENSERLGSTRNFAACIAACQGDAIALCDQDDVWLPSKLCRLESELQRSPQSAFVFSDAVLVDAELRAVGDTLWEAVRFDAAARQLFRQGRGLEVLLRRYVVTGATLVFRSEYRPLLLPIPQGWIHDAWIALLLSTVSRGAFVEEPLIQYRQHPRQQIGEKRRSLLEQARVARHMKREAFDSVAAMFEDAALRVAERGVPPDSGPAMERVVDAFRQKAAHFQQRARMRDAGVWRLPIILRELGAGRYGRYSLGWKSAVQDLLL